MCAGRAFGPILNLQWYIFLFSPEMNDSLAERIIQCPALRQIDKPLRPNHFTHQVSAGAVLRLKFFRYLLPSFCGPAPLHELGSCAKDSLNLLRPALEMSYLRDKAIRVPPLRAAGLVLRSCSEGGCRAEGGLGGIPGTTPPNSAALLSDISSTGTDRLRFSIPCSA